MSEQETDWYDLVQRYAARGPDQDRAVREAQDQAVELHGTGEYWEAVYTLAHQRVQMREAAKS